jgi:hypothetical protein
MPTAACETDDDVGRIALRQGLYDGDGLRALDESGGMTTRLSADRRPVRTIRW